MRGSLDLVIGGCRIKVCAVLNWSKRSEALSRLANIYSNLLLWENLEKLTLLNYFSGGTIWVTAKKKKLFFTLTDKITMNNPIIPIAYKLLEQQSIYDAYQGCVGSLKYRRQLVSKLILRGLDSYLDIGCGTASTVDLLPASANYIGVDISEKYLVKARQKRSDLILINGDISKKDWVSKTNLEKSTMCIALGIYHHLDDYQLNLMLDNCLSVLPSGSQIFSMDPLVSSTSTKLAKWFAKNDRGKFVRAPEEIEPFFTSKGIQVEFQAKTNQMRIPLDTLEITATLN
jgi:SAM-dependent methyltransferase